MTARDRRWVQVAVLVRQRRGSAKGVMFITLEDETAVANLVVWQKIFETRRARAGMIGVRGRIQREGEVVHLVAHHLTDLSAELASVGARDTAFSLSRGCSAEIHRASPGPDLRDMSNPHLHLDEIKVKTKNFR